MTAFRLRLGHTLSLVLSSILVVASCRAQTLPILGDRLDVDLNGNLFALDVDHSMLREYSATGSLLREVGGAGWSNNQFDHPEGIWARNGVDVFVADYGNHRIQRFDRNLAYVSTLFTRDNDNPDIRFGYPTGVSVSRLGELYVCDSENDRIVKVGNTSTVTLTFGGISAGEGRLMKPVGIACGPGDQVYVLDPPRVMVYDAFGNFLGELFKGGFHAPRALAADAQCVAVLDSTGVMIFDEAHHVAGSLVQEHADAAVTQASGLALAKGSLFLLGPGGVQQVPNPRYARSRSGLEKEPESH